jgi:HCOMODA/2-hydroxy-3-carboxy-muconic semialdehyde decarboxylase
MDHGRSLARTLGQGRLALMRGHGSVVTATSVPQVVSACIAMDKNARVQLQAMQLGEVIPLSTGEIDRPTTSTTNGVPLPDRAWEAFTRRAGF